MQITNRDRAMVAWLEIVGIADVDAVRWALAAFAGNEVPVTPRRANVWISRMVEVGLLERGRPHFRDASIVWATVAATGKQAPNIYKQTTRHEVAVATAAARYLAHGYAWNADPKSRGKKVDVAPNGTSTTRKQADGVAVSGDLVDLIEVELTPKTEKRYREILPNHFYRMGHEGVSRVVYLTTPETAPLVTRLRNELLHRDWLWRMPVHAVFDVRGVWVAGDFGLWGTKNDGETVGVDHEASTEGTNQQ